MTEKTRVMEPCDKCGKKYIDHSFVELLTCVYSGFETKAGHPFGRKDAEVVRNSIVERLR